MIVLCSTNRRWAFTRYGLRDVREMIHDALVDNEYSRIRIPRYCKYNSVLLL